MEAIVRLFDSNVRGLESVVLKGTFDIQNVKSLEEVKEQFLNFSEEFKEKLKDIRSRRANLFLKDFQLQSVGNNTFLWSALIYGHERGRALSAESSPRIRHSMTFLTDVVEDLSCVSNKKLGVWQNTLVCNIINEPVIPVEVCDLFGIDHSDYMKEHLNLKKRRTKKFPRTKGQYWIDKAIDVIFPFSYDGHTYYFLLEGLSFGYEEELI
jgi:hypothetical protein